MRIGYGIPRQDGDDSGCDETFLNNAGAERIFMSSGQIETLATLERAISHLRSGDVFLVSSIGRLGVTLEEIVVNLQRISGSGAEIQIGELGANPGSLTGDAILRVSGYLSMCLPELRSKAGRESRAMGPGNDAVRRRGRPAAIGENHHERIKTLVHSHRLPINQVALRFGVSSATIYRILGRT